VEPMISMKELSIGEELVVLSPILSLFHISENHGYKRRLISGRYLSLILRTAKHWFKLDIFTSTLKSY
jgi:hypothetical protein